MAKHVLRWAPACTLPLLLVACDAAGEAQPATTAAAMQTAPDAVEVVDTLPLRRGFYVRNDDTCAAPSNATLALVRRDGITSCDFTAIQRIGESRYRVQETCKDHQGPAPSTYELTQEYEILAEDRYRVTYEYGETVEFGFCPQQSLPEPWKTNDISDLID
ncbi:hypothetical protein E2F46_04160 [Luteimonas aestuarii]|uniref:Lipoprotein n=1 Tax=Luteimonas aestuarii TaxID=453837 RepID=A0A4R5U1C2_9GAMM|nr:hypothetical protein [Luteimonas aestuarii]TDK27390.1 hypothetical protein E2F46_04160 [Luteimonas aestuarii]